MTSVDERDLRVLYELSLDSRQPLGRIAKKAGISRQAVGDRIRKLQKDGVIRGFITEVDVRALGLTKNVVYLELVGATREKEEEIQKALLNHPLVCWIDLSTGKWSFIFDLHCKDSDHLALLVDWLKAQVGEFLGDLQIVTLRDYEYFAYKYFSREHPPKSPQLSVKTKLDEKDQVILRHLCGNSRISLLPLSKETGLTPEAVSRRITTLAKSGVIRRFSIFVDLEKLGYELYNVQISLATPNKKNEDAIIAYLSKHPRVSFCVRPITQWDIEFGVFIKKPEDLRDVIRALREAFPRKIRIKDAVLFYDEISSQALPEGAFNQQISEPLVATVSGKPQG